LGAADAAWRSVLVLDSDIDDGVYTVSGLTADTGYTLTVAALSVAGQSEDVVVANLTTSSVTVSGTVSRFIAATAVVAPVLVILVLIGVYTCVRCVCSA